MFNKREKCADYNQLIQCIIKQNLAPQDFFLAYSKLHQQYLSPLKKQNKKTLPQTFHIS